MILSGQSIRNSIRIEPFHERTKAHGMTFGLSIAGYDVRLRQELDLASGQFMLGSIVEYIEMPNNAIGIVHDKSTLARLGLALQNTVIEPGWKGTLTVEISNHGPERVRLPAGSPIAQILFHRTDAPCATYEGRYQNQGGEPQPALFMRDEDDGA